MSKRARAVPFSQAEQDRALQKYISSIQWAKDPKKAAAQLRRIAKELETDIDVDDFKYKPGKKVKSKDIKNAREWFKGEIKSLLSDPMQIDHKRVSKYTRGEKAISVPHKEDIGRMMTYSYDPKTKNEMPYYDIFPLILLVEPLEDGFFGLNLHYLPPKQREILITRLMEHMYSNNKIDKNTRIKMSYKLLKGVSKYRYFKPCFKRYLFSHLKTVVKPIPFTKWPNAMLLPFARFKKAGIASVWADSLKISRQ